MRMAKFQEWDGVSSETSVFLNPNEVVSIAEYSRTPSSSTVKMSGGTTWIVLGDPYAVADEIRAASDA